MDVCKTGGRHSFDNDPELLPKRDWKSFYLTLQKALLGGAPSDRFRCGIEIRVKQIVADYRLNGEPEALGTCRDRGTSDDEIPGPLATHHGARGAVLVEELHPWSRCGSFGTAGTARRKMIHTGVLHLNARSARL